MITWITEPERAWLGRGVTTNATVNGFPIEVLVDTGATSLVLPREFVIGHGIKATGSRRIQTSAGIVSMPWIEGLRLEVLGRTMVSDAVVKDGGSALLGQRQLEELDLIVLPRKGEVRHNTLGAVQLPGEWFNSGCGSGPRARWLPSGAIEIEGQGTPKRALPSGVLKWSQEIRAASTKHSVPWNLTAGIMSLESRGKQDALSPANACGLMQLIPSTATNQAGRPVTCKELLTDAKLNIDLGTKFLAELMDRYHGNPIKVGAAYNAGGAYCGPGKKCTSPNRWNLVTDCGPSGQGVDYPGIVIGYANSALDEFGPTTSPVTSRGSSASPLTAGLLIGGAALAYYLWRAS